MRSSAPAILLDLDGTLIDSQPGILSSCQAALRMLGHERKSMHDLSAVIGPPMDDVRRFLPAPYGDDRIAEAVTAYRADYGKNGLFQSTAYDGVADALTKIREAGAQPPVP